MNKEGKLVVLEVGEDPAGGTNMVWLAQTMEEMMGEVYGVDRPDQLDDQQKHQAYEAMKLHVKNTARSPEEYNQNIKVITNFLEI